MKNHKNTLPLLIAFTLIVLNGCNGNPSNTTSTSQSNSENTTIAQTTTSSETNISNGNSWEIDKSPVTLEWFISYDWYGKKFNPQTNLADKKILDDTGVSLNISTGNFDKLNVLIATSSLPDLVTTDIIATQRKMMEEGGLVMPLEPLEQQYAPDLNVPQSMKDWFRSKDGNWYSIASFYYGPERCSDEFGGYIVTHNNNFVRTDILEQIGFTIDDMKTREGLLNACRAVKENNIKYDGSTVVPFQGVNALFMAQQFGMKLEDENGNLLTDKRQPEYLEALKFFNQMYNEKLFTDEEFTMDVQQKETKVAAGHVFAANGWMLVQKPRQSLYSSDPNALMMYCGQVKPDEGKEQYLESINSAGWTATLISSNTKHADRAIRLFSYMTTEEATLDAQYGVGCYDIVNGQAKKKPEIVKEFEDNYQAATAKYMSDISYFVDWTIIEKYYDTEVTGVYEKDALDMERDKTIKIYDNKCFQDVIPVGGTDLAAIQARIDEYWKQAEANMIMASSQEECTNLYNKAIEEIEKLGLKQLEEYKNQRFKENKEKLNIKFAWPSLQ